MLRSRVIPCLLFDGHALVKTTQFANPKYVGDPLNTVRLFNEKEVDELLLLDIKATVDRREPNYDLIEDVAGECRMPLCYGGGVRTVDQVDRIVSMGVEKVSVSSDAVEKPTLVGDMAARVGRQSVVVSLDVRRHRTVPGVYEVWTHNGTRNTNQDVLEVACRVERAGAGEVLINSIDADGTMDGYDLQVAQVLREHLDIPMTVLGGAGSLDDIAGLIASLGTVGAAAGSLFVFKGPYRAVLVTYPDREFLESLLPG